MHRNTPIKSLPIPSGSEASTTALVSLIEFFPAETGVGGGSHNHQHGTKTHSENQSQLRHKNRVSRLSGPSTWLLVGRSDNPKPDRQQQSHSCRELLAYLLNKLEPFAARNNRTVSGRAMEEEENRPNDQQLGIEWALRYTPDGAPTLLRFGAATSCPISFSHSGAYCAVALSHHQEVAVDIERFGSRRNFTAMNEYMNWRPGNWHLGNWHPEPCSERSFLARWTLWESFAKLNSSSVLSQDMDGFDALESQMKPEQLCHAASWSAFQTTIHHQACVTLLMKNEQHESLQHRVCALNESSASSPWDRSPQALSPAGLTLR